MSRRVRLGNTHTHSGTYMYIMMTQGGREGDGGREGGREGGRTLILFTSTVYLQLINKLSACRYHNEDKVISKVK